MNRETRRAITALRPDISLTTTFAVVPAGLLVGLAAHEPGTRRPRLAGLDPMVAAQLGAELLAAALGALPPAEAAQLASQLFAAATATPPVCEVRP